MEFGYRQLEDLLATLHDIDDRQRIALQGRIKHFQRNGWPGGTNTGKGRAAKYDFGSMIRLCLGFELLEIGLTPERAVQLLKTNWDYVATALSLAFSSHELSKNSQPFDVVIYCDPKALYMLRDDNYIQDKLEDYDFFYNSTLQLGRQMISSPKMGVRRLALINISDLVGEIASFIGSWELLSSEYSAWDAVERPTQPADQIASKSTGKGPKK